MPFASAKRAGLITLLGLPIFFNGCSGPLGTIKINDSPEDQEKQNEFIRTFGLGMLLGGAKGRALQVGDVKRASIFDSLEAVHAARAGRNETNVTVNHYSSFPLPQTVTLVPPEPPYNWPSPTTTSWNIPFRDGRDVTGDGRIEPREFVDPSYEVNLDDPRTVYFGFHLDKIDCGYTLHILARDGPADDVFRSVHNLPEGAHSYKLYGHWKYIGGLTEKIHPKTDVIFATFNPRDLKAMGAADTCHIRIIPDQKNHQVYCNYLVDFISNEKKTD